MSEACVACNAKFIEGPHGHKRKRLLKATTPKIARAVFPNVSPQEESFICYQCVSILNKRTKRKGSTKRVILLPAKAPSCATERIMPEACIACNAKFIKKGKGYGRIRLLTLTTPTIARAVFPNVSPQEESCLCLQCVSILKKRTKGPKSLKNGARKRDVLLPVKAPSCATQRIIIIKNKMATGSSSPSSPKDATTQRIIIITNKMATGSSIPPSPKDATGSSIPSSPKNATGSSIPSSPKDETSKKSKKVYSSLRSSHTMNTQKKPRKPSPTAAPLAKARYCVSSRQYLTAFRWFLKSKVKDCMVTAFIEAILRERVKLSKDPDGPLRKVVDPESVSAFTWQSLNEWAEQKAPLMMACLSANFQRANGKMITEEQAEKEAEELERRRGMTLATALFFSDKSHNHFIQTCMGIQLWKEGCSSNVHKTLSHAGLCVNVTSTRAAIDTMSVRHDAKMQKWKRNAMNLSTKRTLDSAGKYKVAKQQRTTYSVTWDNVQSERDEESPSMAGPSPKRQKLDANWTPKTTVHGKHVSKDRGNKMPFALCFATENRINNSHLKDAGCKAIEVPARAVLPTPQVFQSLRDRMVILVMRMLVANLTHLSRLQKKVNQHITHQFTQEMDKKSEIVKLGVVSSDPSSPSGVLAIMDHLHGYVPNVRKRPIPILCNGDALSIERMIQCKRSRAGSQTPAQCLTGLIPAPQEFTKETLLLQDTMNLLFKQESETSRGTLSQLMAFFHHKPLKKQVSANFEHAWDVMEFSATAYITLLATTLCGMETADEAPQHFPTTSEEQVAWLKSLANQIVDFAWMAPEQEQVKLVAASYASGDKSDKGRPFLHCCKKDLPDKLVQCSSNVCETRWFHSSCAKLTDVEEVKDWHCSPECEENPSYIYCWCKEKRGGDMLQCQLGTKCRKSEWYHSDCFLPGTRPSEHDLWYCSEECRMDGTSFPTDLWYCAEECQMDGTEQEEDYVQNYTKAVMWEGLNLLARRDAVCEGDGLAMVDSWRLDLLQFWGRGHPKHLMIGHHMLNGIGGHLPASQRADLIWNRVVNTSGQKAANIGLDLLNEFLSKDFKETVRIGNRREVQRCAQVGGEFGKDLDALLTSAGTGNVDSSTRRGDDDTMVEDIKSFVSEFQADELFKRIPGRFHKGFENFTCSTTIRDPVKMGRRLRKLAEDIDTCDRSPCPESDVTVITTVHAPCEPSV